MPNEVKLLPCDGYYSIAPSMSFKLMGDGRVLLLINPDGTVEGLVEDAGEAAKVFVEALRHQLEPMFATRPTTVVTDEIVERVAEALQEVDLHDGDEGNHYRLFDLLGFSGENKSVMITRQLARAALASMPTVVTGEQPQDLGEP